MEFGTYALLGLLAGAVGIGFIKTLYGIEDLADKLWRGPEWLRPAVGGVLLGGLLLALPQLYGVGYPVLTGALTSHYLLWFLLILLVGKMLATSLTIAIGGSGGVFAPSLFVGAMAGTAFGQLAHTALPGLVGSPGAYGIVGMGAVFAATSRAPITAVLIIFELTGDYSIILPLMTAVVIATAVSKKLSADTIYTLKLRRRGIDLLRGRAASLLETLTVAAAMRPVPTAITTDAPLEEMLASLTDAPDASLPVIDSAGHYRGVLTPRHVEDAARDNTLDTTAGQLATTSPALSDAQTLAEALDLLEDADEDGLPVISPDGTRLVGHGSWDPGHRLQARRAQAPACRGIPGHAYRGAGGVLILVARASAAVWEVARSSSGVIVNLAKKMAFVNHYSFHIMDPEWGHVTIKMSGHPPFGAQVILNGHEYVAAQALAAGIGFTKQGNCFTAVADPAGLAQVADTLSHPATIGRLSQARDRWIYSACLCFGLDLDEQTRSGFTCGYSVYQAEYSRNLMFKVGAQMEKVFDRVVDRTRSRLDVPTLRTLLGAKQRPARNGTPEL